MSPGRPSKINRKLIDDAVKLSRDGLPRRFIAGKLGIDEGTYARWFARGAGDQRGIYREFHLEVAAAESEFVEASRDALAALGSKNPRHLQWWLSRLHPSEFGRRDNVEPINVEDRAAQAQATRALLMERLERLRLEPEPPPAPEVPTTPAEKLPEEKK